MGDVSYERTRRSRRNSSDSQHDRRERVAEPSSPPSTRPSQPLRRRKSQLRSESEGEQSARSQMSFDGSLQHRVDALAAYPSTVYINSLLTPRFFRGPLGFRKIAFFVSSGPSTPCASTKEIDFHAGCSRRPNFIIGTFS